MPYNAARRTSLSKRGCADHVKDNATTPHTTKYTWDEVRKHNSLEDCWIVVEGKVYDVTSWVPRHPGGSIMISGAGRESTAFMHSYHPDYVVACTLPKYCVGEVEGYKDHYTWGEESKFYSTVKERVYSYMKREGLSRDSWKAYAQTFVLFFAWAVAYYYGFIKGYVISTLILSVLHVQLGINVMHDGSHGAYSSSSLLCLVAAYIADFMGASHIVWRHQHTIGHHPHTNHVSEAQYEGTSMNPINDPDANGGYPFVRLNPSQPLKPYMRYQHIYIWFLVCFNNLLWFFSDFAAFSAEKYTFIDFHKLSFFNKFMLYFMKVLFVAYAVVAPVYALGPVAGIAHFVLFVMITSLNFAVMFGINHLSEDATFPDSSISSQTRDWATLQVLTSNNFATDSTFWTLASGALNYQIEHHLFPGVNHVHLPSISPIIKETCKEFGLPYTNFPSYTSAVYSFYSHLKNLGRLKTC